MNTTKPLTENELEQLIQEAIANRTPVKLRDGSKAFVVYDARKYKFDFIIGTHPIVGMKHDGEDLTWSPSGKYTVTHGSESSNDIVGNWFDLHPLENIPKDHPIYVRDAVYQNWVAGHFSNLQPDSEHPICIYFNGKTSITSKCTSGWKEYRLPTADELKGTAWEGSEFVAE